MNLHITKYSALNPNAEILETGSKAWVYMGKGLVMETTITGHWYSLSNLDESYSFDSDKPGIMAKRTSQMDSNGWPVYEDVPYCEDGLIKGYVFYWTDSFLGHSAVLDDFDELWSSISVAKYQLRITRKRMVKQGIYKAGKVWTRRSQMRPHKKVISDMKSAGAFIASTHNEPYGSLPTEKQKEQINSYIQELLSKNKIVKI